jgi:membrane protein DedA with SNARE-associated domain
MGIGLLVVMAWFGAHLALLALALGLGIGYLIGRHSGRRRAVLDEAREIVGERARSLARL